MRHNFPKTGELWIGKKTKRLVLITSVNDEGHVTFVKYSKPPPYDYGENKTRFFVKRQLVDIFSGYDPFILL